MQTPGSQAGAKGRGNGSPFACVPQTVESQVRFVVFDSLAVFFAQFKSDWLQWPFCSLWITLAAMSLRQAKGGEPEGEASQLWRPEAPAASRACWTPRVPAWALAVRGGPQTSGGR